MRTVWKFLKFVSSLAILIITLLNGITLSEKIELNKDEAMEILKETYKPLEAFAESLSISTDGEKLVLPNTIESEQDFINLFSETMRESTPKSIYKKVNTEKGISFMDSSTYIPSIYTQHGKVTEAYIIKKKKLIDFIRNKSKTTDKVIIKESWTISGDKNKRTNYYIRGEQEEWLLDYFDGIVSYGFADANRNPWYYNK